MNDLIAERLVMVPEVESGLGLTHEEKQVIEIVQASASSGFTNGLEQAKAVVMGTGCEIEIIGNGSNPNKGSLSRNRRFPQGRITLMGTITDTPESILRELAHEFLYLQLLKLALPNPDDIHDQEKFEQAAKLFIAGLKPRLLAEIAMAQTIEDEDRREIRVGDRERMLGKIQDETVALEIAMKFIIYH